MFIINTQKRFNIYNFTSVTHKTHETHRRSLTDLQYDTMQSDRSVYNNLQYRGVKVFIVPPFLILMYRASFVTFPYTVINYNLTSKEKYNQKAIPHFSIQYFSNWDMLSFNIKT